MFDGKNYAMIGPADTNYPTLLVRKENGRYYGRTNIYGIFREEYIFLQDNLPKGETWTNEILEGKEVYTIVSIDKRRTIGGKEYTNIIEVKKEFYYKQGNEYTLSYTYWSIYAKDIGNVLWSLDQNQEYTLTDFEIR